MRHRQEGKSSVDQTGRGGTWRAEQILQVQQAMYIRTVREELSRLNIPSGFGESEEVFWQDAEHSDMVRMSPYESEDKYRQVTVRREAHRQRNDGNESSLGP